MIGLARRLFRRLWYVYPPVVLTVQATPAVCLHALATAARPNLDRLHLRNLFTEGRRYYVAPSKRGFKLTSNSKLPWRRARTAVVAVVDGEFSNTGNRATRIQLHARMQLLFFLDIFLIPTFMASIIIFAPWTAWLRTLLIVVLFGLSLAWHRLTATLQAADMVYFVERALEEMKPAEVFSLGSDTENIITLEREFREQWQEFYEQHKNDSSADHSPA